MKHLIAKRRYGHFSKMSVSVLFITLFVVMGIHGHPQYHLGDTGLPSDYYDSMAPSIRTLRSLPTSWDWNAIGMVTVAKDQGYCSSCWAFTACGTMESKLLMLGLGVFDLSEQDQISCNTLMGGCVGGSMTSLRYWLNRGPKEEACTGYPSYGGSVPSCSTLDVCAQLPFRSTDYYTVNADSVTDVKTSLYNDGPGYFRYDVYTDFYNYWNTGSSGAVYTQSYGTKEGGHAVLIIGWDDGKQAWLCKNSWGAGSGPNDDGTFWISYYGHSQDLGFGMANINLSNVIQAYHDGVDELDVNWTAVPEATSYKIYTSPGDKANPSFSYHATVTNPYYESVLSLIYLDGYRIKVSSVTAAGNETTPVEPLYYSWRAEAPTCIYAIHDFHEIMELYWRVNRNGGYYNIYITNGGGIFTHYQMVSGTSLSWKIQYLFLLGYRIKVSALESNIRESIPIEATYNWD